jgi:diacylglycerol kinase (ATP)
VTSERRPILLLHNPVAGAKPGAGSADSGGVPLPALEEALTGHGLAVASRELSAEDDPRALAAAAVADGRDVVVAGGDGTVGPAAASMVGTDRVLGIVPTGSFNNVARGLGVPLEPIPAVEAIARGREVVVDTGLAWHPAPDAAPDQPPPLDAQTFLEAAGVGLDAEGFGVAAAGARRGPLAAIGVAWRALRARHPPVELVLDGRTVRTSSPAVTACNGPYHGLGFALAPDADAGDGLLDVVVFAGMTRFEVLAHFLSVARRRPRSEARVRIVRAARVTVRGRRGVLPAHVDGRPFGVTPVAFAVRPASLRVYR